MFLVTTSKEIINLEQVAGFIFDPEKPAETLGVRFGMGYEIVFEGEDVPIVKNGLKALGVDTDKLSQDLSRLREEYIKDRKEREAAWILEQAIPST